MVFIQVQGILLLEYFFSHTTSLLNAYHEKVSKILMAPAGIHPTLTKKLENHGSQFFPNRQASVDAVQKKFN
jgi:hypothetical protein